MTDEDLERLKEAISEHGPIITTRETIDDEILIDFFMGDEDVAPLNRYGNGEFGSSVIYDPIKKEVSGVIRLGDIDIEGDDWAWAGLAEFEDYVYRKRPPTDELNVTFGDLSGTIIHIRIFGEMEVGEFIKFYRRLMGGYEQELEEIREKYEGI